MILRNTAPEKEMRKWSQVGETGVGCEKTLVLCLWGTGLFTEGVLEEWFFLVCFQSAFLLWNAEPIFQGARAASPREPQPCLRGLPPLRSF